MDQNVPVPAELDTFWAAMGGFKGKPFLPGAKITCRDGE